MRYYASLHGQERVIDVEKLEGSRFRLRIDGGEARVVDAERLDGHVVHLLVDGKSHEIDLEPDGDALALLVEDELFHLEMIDERKKRLLAARGKFTVEGKVVVRAPMPGKVVKVLVQPGSAVAEHQGLIVIEAMKMENELFSPRAGKVTGVFVQEGQTVEGRAELVSVE